MIIKHYEKDFSELDDKIILRKFVKRLKHNRGKGIDTPS
jgi:hypothetical protein